MEHFLDDGFEQAVLVGEVDVERSLGDAGGAGDLAHAGAVEPEIQEHSAGAIEKIWRRTWSCFLIGDEGEAGSMCLQPLVYLLGKDFNRAYAREGILTLWSASRKCILTERFSRMLTVGNDGAFAAGFGGVARIASL